MKGGAFLLIFSLFVFYIKLSQPLSRLLRSHYCFQLSIWRSLIKGAVRFCEPDDRAPTTLLWLLCSQDHARRLLTQAADLGPRRGLVGTWSHVIKNVYGNARTNCGTSPASGSMWKGHAFRQVVADFRSGGKQLRRNIRFQSLTGSGGGGKVSQDHIQICTLLPVLT